ncbi:hypothetical protein [Superficieibacter sp. HKU1]|uniref:hypothetical protein n=1 Tax=Superficieibacter sp. HKU1 TaxID=3031919 RepID=UPI0023E1C226|nr:hypothetical protein [Superficieibacter sp. HKU1]WES66574.1 hypothetical protein P0H77_12915 [Superficieibacter sp. HKU1]
MNVRTLKKIFLILWLMFTGYSVFTEYQHHHHARIATGIVSNVVYTSSAERRMTDTCTHFRGREDCSARYDYDITWYSQNKDYVYHADDEREKPSAVECVHVVPENPQIGKPCKNIFFNDSHLPAVITVWAVLGFIFLTMLMLKFKQRRFSVPEEPQLYRVYNKSFHLLFETRLAEDAMQFIRKGHYRLRASNTTLEAVVSGGKKAMIKCANYHVRSRKGRRKLDL